MDRTGLKILENNKNIQSIISVKVHEQLLLMHEIYRVKMIFREIMWKVTIRGVTDAESATSENTKLFMFMKIYERFLRIMCSTSCYKERNFQIKFLQNLERNCLCYFFVDLLIITYQDVRFEEF
jgi:hypothetical protein